MGCLLLHLLLLLHLVSLRILLVLELAASFIFSVEHHEFLSVLLVLHAKLLPDLHKAAQAVNIVLVLVINLLVDLEGLIE